MKESFHFWSLIRLVITICMLCGGSSWSQVLTVIHSFGGSDGAQPFGALTTSGHRLFGTTIGGGKFDGGTVFAMDDDGANFKVLYSFSGSDGANPYGDLVLTAGDLYGTTHAGGDAGNGTVFKISTDGTGFRTLHSFSPGADNGPPGALGTVYTNSDGISPIAGLALCSGILYGSTTAGGNSDNGTLFSLNADGSGFSVLGFFGGLFAGPGAGPQSTLLVLGGKLYGVAGTGFDRGRLFVAGTSGGMSTLYDFNTSLLPNPGMYPVGGLAAWGDTLYGTTLIDGSSTDAGLVFRIKVDGTGFENLHHFRGYPDEGAHPTTALVVLSNFIYGVTYNGGPWDWGTVFSMNSDGTGFTNLYSFDGGARGGHPASSLIVSKSRLFGTTQSGGSSGGGMIFTISFAPQLHLAQSTTNLILTWPTNYAGFDCASCSLQATTNLASGIWTANFSTPAIVKGQYTVTNPISGTQQFFRLSQ